MGADLSGDRTSWINRFDFADKSNFESYVAAFYWVTQTVVTVGFYIN